MIRLVVCAGLIGMLAACGGWPRVLRPAPEAVPEVRDASGQVRPVARPLGLKLPQNARTIEEFDTTSAEERTEAVQGVGVGGVDLGLTVVSLGSATEPGIWLKTPLVKTTAKGRVEYPAKGTSVAVELIPIEGDAGSGSRISLAAMRLIEANLTGLPELRVYRMSN